MRKYEKDLIFGTLMTLAGVFFLVYLRFGMILSWSVIIIGKLIVILSVMEYVDRIRAIKGEDLGSDNQFKKVIRKIRKKRYN